MNWDVDFQKSMELFLEEIDTVGIEDIDGVIAVDTQLVVYILDAIGPIDVTGYGSFGTENEEVCNCPQVIYELESFADIGGPVVWSENEPGKIVFAPPNYDNRKKIIGPLMNSLITNSTNAPVYEIPALINSIFRSMYEKHVILYMVDEDIQNSVITAGLSGKITNYNGDYLYINDANLGGRKTNLYVEKKVDQKVVISSDGIVNKLIDITYSNPVGYDGWLNSVLPNYVRIYVPEGSSLIKMIGLADQIEPYNEHGKTVFAGYFELDPEGLAKVSLEYSLPIKFANEYRTFIQKQPGTSVQNYVIDVNGQRREFDLVSDHEIMVEF
jgi:hypothetical protein